MGRVGPAFLLLLLLLLLPSAASADTEVDREIARLGHGNAAVREHAAKALREMGPRAEPAIPALIVALRAETLWADDALAAVGKPAVPALIPLLEDGEERLAAVRILGRMGKDAAAALPALIELLGSREPTLRSSVVRSLGRIGAPARPAEEPLKRLLRDPDLDVRAYAVESLFRIGAGDRDAMRIAIELLLSAGSLYADDALEAIGEPAVVALVEAYPLARGDARGEIIDTLSDIGPPAAAAVPLLIDLLAGGHGAGADLRLAAGRALAEIGLGDESAIGKLELASYEPGMAGWCIDALASIGPAARPALIELAGRHTGDALVAALDALAALGAGSVPFLEKRLADKDERTRVTAAFGLLRIDPDHDRALEAVSAHWARGSPGDFRYRFREAGPAALAALTRWLAAESPSLRAAAADTWAIQPAGTPRPLEKLTATLADPDTVVRRAAAGALDLSGLPEKTVLALRQALGDSDREVRVRAAFALARSGKGRPEDGSPLLAIAADPEADRCAEAAEALGVLRTEGAAEALAKALASSDAWVVGPAQDALVALGEPAIPAVLNAFAGPGSDNASEVLARIGGASLPALISAAGSADGETRDAVLTLLPDFRHRAKLVVPVLVAALDRLDGRDALDRPDESVSNTRAIAARGLGSLGPRAKVALPSLRKLIDEKDRYLRSEALAAIWRISGDAREVLPALRRGLEQEALDLLWLLNEVAERDASAMALLRTYLDHADPDVRVEAAQWLRDDPESRARCISILTEALADEGHRSTAGWALQQGPGERLLTPALKHRDPAVREGAALYLGDYEIVTEAEAMALATALRDRAPEVRRAAASALADSFGHPGIAEKELVQALRDPDPEVRGAAAATLGTIGLHDPASVPAVLQALEAKECVSGAAAALASRGREVVPALIRLLEPEANSTNRRLGAAATLGRIGAAAAPALDLLIEISEDETEDQRLRIIAGLATQDIAADLPVKAIGVGGGAGGK